VLIEQRENGAQRHENGRNLLDPVVPGCAWRRTETKKSVSMAAKASPCVSESTARRQDQEQQHEWHNKSNVNATSDGYDDEREEQVHSMY
jgi:hypothetical protein